VFARWQMGISLAFHIVFAAVGIALPLLMVLGEILWLRRRDADYLRLTRAWAKGAAVLFAVGAVSGTVLSFELGLLFPHFMRQAGALVGLPFSLEGFAFFTEAIFLGLYLYGWKQLSPVAHVFSGIMVALSGLTSAVFVTLVNAWMNTPRGFALQAGQMVAVDPLEAMATPFAVHETVHMVLAAYAATGFAVAAIHAYLLWRHPASDLHRKAVVLALVVAVPATLLQPLVGDLAARQVATWQPAKLAAMEGQFRTQAAAPLRIGGFPDYAQQRTRWALEIPGGLSWLAYRDRQAVVRGLDHWPRADWPSPAVHVAFQIMVGIGFALAALGVWLVIRRLRRRPFSKAMLAAVIAAGPLGVIALEAGWMVTELGRQPWVIYQVMRTAASVTPLPRLWVPLTVFTLIYLGLGAIVALVLWRQIHAPLTEADHGRG
jgi:cytochrome d ubiquinol oxidase subunit I